MMLTHGPIGSASLSLLHGLPTIDDVDISLINALVDGDRIRSSSKSSAGLDSLSESFLVFNRSRKKFSMRFKQIFKNF
jgi:hypothetical protein